MAGPFTRNGGWRLEATEPVEGHLRVRPLGQWAGEVGGLMPVRSSSGTGVHVPAEGERALAVHSVGAVEAVPHGELSGGGSAAVVQDRGERAGLRGRLVVPGGCCGGVLHRVVGDRDCRRADAGELVMERLGHVVLSRGARLRLRPGRTAGHPQRRDRQRRHRYCPSYCPHEWLLSSLLEPGSAMTGAAIAKARPDKAPMIPAMRCIAYSLLCCAHLRAQNTNSLSAGVPFSGNGRRTLHSAETPALSLSKRHRPRAPEGVTGGVNPTGPSMSSGD